MRNKTMHVAIDVDELRVTHVHSDQSILEALVYLECAQRKHVLSANTTSPTFLTVLSTVQLNQLYHNTTCADLPLSFDDIMRLDVIASIVDTMQVPKIVAEELNSQIEIVDDELQEPVDTALQFQYVYGEQVPRILTKCLPTLSAVPATVAQLTTAQQTAAQRRGTETIAVVGPLQQKEATHEPNIIKAPKSGVCAIIWASADEIWEAAGKPVDIAGIKVFLKNLKTTLLARGINKNTISVQIGNWAKTRITRQQI